MYEQIHKIEADLMSLRTQIPNIPEDIVPSEITMTIMKKFSQLNTDFLQGITTLELTAKYDLIDFDLGSKITGAGFPVYKGKGAKSKEG